MAFNNYGNQYADKIYAEHPIALWPLDEDVYYLSLIDDNDRLFSNWTNPTASVAWTSNNSPTLPDISSPFDDNTYSSITKNTTAAGTVFAVSSDTFNPAIISSEIDTFCVNFWLYHSPTYINWFKVGYQYTDTSSVVQTVLSDEISPAKVTSWMNFNNIYTVPQNWTGYIKLIIQIDFASTIGEGDASRSVIMNGLSVGQQSETTCFSSLGNTANFIPQEIGFVNTYGIPADQYGLQSDVGYYLVRNNNLLAKNDGFPIIYGTNHSTKIYPSGSTLPSFIFPGKGMLNEAGRNKQYTLEMWIKVDPYTSTAKRIIGPISSNDGIWVKEGFITVVAGNEIASHCVEEWYRPMLIHLLFKENNITMLINGEQVIDLPFDRATIDLPDTRDWWGVYSYSSINMFKIDSISIYPYLISNIVAKKRFVYGQGTPSIQNIDNDFLGTPIAIDFSTAEYSTNTLYPDVSRWDAGYFNNLDATRNYLSVPNYQLPNINLGGRNLQQWYEDNAIVNNLEYVSQTGPRFITFRPNITYNEQGEPVSWDSDGINYTAQSYFNFNSLNILNDSVAAVYGIFEIDKDIENERTLISFSNTINGSTFDINIEGNQIKYLINGTELLNSSETITIGSKYVVGLNFEIAGLEFGYEVSQFFSSPASIQVYVGGNGINTFEGKIFSIGFCNQANYQKIQDEYSNNEAFLANGLTNIENYELLINHIASYTLVPEYEYNKLYLDISVSSQWEEYYPLMQFASYVKNSDGTTSYDLDMMQLNLGYATIASNTVWKYQELKDEFNGETYQDLKDSQYETYFGLNKKNTTVNEISISDSSLQAYLTFQSLESGANAPLSTFEYTKQLSENYVIDADLENTNINPNRAYETKFAFKDNVILYPPKSQNFEDYAMVVHFDINQRSIIKNPLKIRSFEIASKNLNYLSDNNDESQRNYVGTKFGTRIYPETDLLGQIDYKEKNPYFIYKTATPYIYTTKKSGLQIVNKTSIIDPPTIKQYHVSIPVNKNASYDYTMGALKFFLLAQFDETLDEVPFIEIKHKNGITTLVLNKNETGTSIVAYDKNTMLFLDGGLSSTASGLFTDILDAENSGSEETAFFDANIQSVSQSPVENAHTIHVLQNETTIDDTNNTITFASPHGYATGTQIVYTSLDPINGLFNDDKYFVRAISNVEISLYTTETDAVADTNRINLSGVFTGIGSFTEYPYVKIENYEFYQNGRYVKSPSIKNYEWNYIGITFPNGLDFGEYAEGEINLFGGFVFNNLSYYLAEGLGIKSDISIRVWNEILNQSDIVNAVGDGTLVTYTTLQEHNLQEGQYIKISDISPSSLNIGDETTLATVNSIINAFSFTVENTSIDTYSSGGVVEYIWKRWEDVPWSEAYVLGQTSSYVTTPADIYNAYTGTNRDVVDDGYGIGLSQVETVAITDASWTFYSGKPA